MNLQEELKAWLDEREITPENIGDIRRSCFVPWDSEWNGFVRDETAARETSGRKTKRLSPESASLIAGALDSLGVALTNHNHQWSDGERAIYEEARSLLGMND